MQRRTTAFDLEAAYKMCRWVGLFRPPTNGSWFVACVYGMYRTILFVVVFVVSVSMTAQLFMSPDLSTVARTIDMLTMCWSGLYKWCAVVAFSARFAEFRTMLIDIQGQAAAAYGDKAAEKFVWQRGRHISAVSYVYVLGGFLVTVVLAAGPLISYPKG